MHCSLRKHMQIDRNTSTLKKIPSLLLTADFNDSPTASTTSAHTDQSVRTCTPSYSANCWGQNWQRVRLQQNAEWPMRQKHWWKQRGAAYRERERERERERWREGIKRSLQWGRWRRRPKLHHHLPGVQAAAPWLYIQLSLLQKKNKKKKHTPLKKYSPVSLLQHTAWPYNMCVCVFLCAYARNFCLISSKSALKWRGQLMSFVVRYEIKLMIDLIIRWAWLRCSSALMSNY